MTTKLLKEDEALKRLESALKSAGATAKRDFNEKLFNSIMEEVAEIKPTSKWVIALTKRENIVAAAASMVAVVSLWLLNSQKPKTVYVVERSVNTQDWIVGSSLENPLMLQETLNAHTNEERLVFDTLAVKMENLTDEELVNQVEELLK